MCQVTQVAVKVFDPFQDQGQRGGGCEAAEHHDFCHGQRSCPCLRQARQVPIHSNTLSLPWDERLQGADRAHTGRQDSCSPVLSRE